MTSAGFDDVAVHALPLVETDTTSDTCSGFGLNRTATVVTRG